MDSQSKQRVVGRGRGGSRIFTGPGVPLQSRPCLVYQSPCPSYHPYLEQTPSSLLFIQEMMSSYHRSAKSLQLVSFSRKRISLVSHRKTDTLTWNGIGVCEAISVSGLVRGRQEAMDPGHRGNTGGQSGSALPALLPPQVSTSVLLLWRVPVPANPSGGSLPEPC